MASLKYQQQDSAQTLREALDEYYAQSPELLTESNTDSTVVTDLFKPHDIVHVIFGCNISIHDETLADAWTIFGSTVGLRTYLAYLKYPETTDVLQDSGYYRVFREFLQAIPDVVTVFRRTRKMLKKWPWRGYEAYLDQSLKTIRQDFGIQILSAVSSEVVV